MFVSRLNSMSGKMEWVVTGKDLNESETDLSEEFSRSQYGDMIHDTERNHKYYEGLRWAVNQWKSKGVEPIVLDIGTGTGLLSLMAAKCGAKKVIACEALRPMVKISREVIRDNGFESIIRVVPKRSTDLTVGPDGDMKERAHILVSEVFDSELIGEGAIGTFSHAAGELLIEGALVIPSTANVYIQLIHSPFLWQSQSLDPSQFPQGVNITVPGSWKRCPGPASLWDLHLEEVSVPEQLIHLSDPYLMGKFDFSDPNLPNKKIFPSVSVTPTHSGQCHGVAVWWTINMAPGVELSMSPWQLNGQWRDHWLACVQLVSEPLSIDKDISLNCQLVNDDYTLWTVINNNVSTSVPPLCTCGVHLAWSRPRMRMINDSHRNQLLMNALKRVLPGRSTVLCVSDGSLLPFMCTTANETSNSDSEKKSLKKIFTVENNSHSAKAIQELLTSSNINTDLIQVLTDDPTELSPTHLKGQTIDLLVAEPFFITTTLPWHNLFYWYVRSSVQSLLSPDAIVMPCAAYLKAIAVQFDNLHFLKAPVGSDVEGFDITAYDRAVLRCYSTDTPPKALPPEDYYLWEYPCYPLSGVQTLMKFDFTVPVPKETTLEETGSWLLTTPTASCHGIVMWMEYQLTTDSTVLLSEGLIGGEDGEGKKVLQWSSGHSQAVSFFVSEESVRREISFNVKMNTSNCTMEFDFR